MRQVCVFLVIAFVCGFSRSAIAQNQAIITGSKIVDNSGVVVKNGIAHFQPHDGKLTPLSYRMSGGGLAIRTPTTCTILNGAISGTCKLPNTYLTNPLHVCFNFWVTNSTGGASILGRPDVIGSGFDCLQPSSGSEADSWCSVSSSVLTCDLDSYTPNLPTIAPITAMRLKIGTVTTGDPGSLAVASISGSTPDYALDLKIPTGAAGPNCASTSPAGECDLNEGVLIGTHYQVDGARASGYLAARIAEYGANSTITLGPAYAETLTSSVSVTAKNIHIQCLPGATLTKGANIDMLTLTGASPTVEGCNFSGVGGTYTGNGIVISGASGPRIIGNTIANTAGFGVLVDGSGTAVINPQITGNTITATSNSTSSASDPIYVTGNVNGGEISGNTVDTSALTTWGHGIGVHSATAGQRVQNLRIVHNTIANGYSYCIEVGAFDGLTPKGITVNGNTCTQAVAATGFGGYSWAGIVDSDTNGNLYANFTGTKATLPAMEIVNADRIVATGNNLIGGSVSMNQASHTVLSSNHIEPLYPKSSTYMGIYLGSSNDGANTDYNDIADNIIDRNGMRTSNPAWEAAKYYSLGTSIFDSNHNLETITNISGNDGCLSGSSTPSWPSSSTSPSATSPIYTVDGGCYWLYVASAPSYASTFYGIWSQCNGTSGTSVDCSYTKFHHNTILDNRTSTGYGIKIENNSYSTSANLIIDHNILSGWATCYSASSSATGIIDSNVEDCTSTGTIGGMTRIPPGGQLKYNLVSDSEASQGCGNWWTCGNGFAPVAQVGVNGSTALEYTGGSMSTTYRSYTPLGNWVSGATIALKVYVDASLVTSGTVMARICADTACAANLLDITATNQSAGWYSGTLTTTSYTTGYFVVQVSSVTTSGAIPFSEPVIQYGSSASYVPTFGGGFGMTNAGGRFASLSVNGSTVCTANGNCSSSKVSYVAKSSGSSLDHLGSNPTAIGGCNSTAATSTLPARSLCTTASASAGYVAGLSDVANYLVSKSPTFITVVGLPATSDYAATRVWVGLGGGISSTYASDNPATNLAAFRASTVAGDTDWMCYTSAGSATSYTLIDSGVSVTSGAGTAHTFRVEVVPLTSATFYIDGTQVCQSAAYLPTGLLAARAYNITNESVIKNIFWTSWEIDQNP